MLAALMLLSVLESKKGLQVQMVDDAIALGVRHAAVNLQMGDYLTTAPRPGDFRLDGTGLTIKAEALKGLDATVKQLTDAGAKVSVILLARATGNEELDANILHSGFDRNSPNKLAAFKTGNKIGRTNLHNFCKFFADRYKKGGSNGTIGAWIVGNEVNSHHQWFSMGPASLAQVADAVEYAMRIVHKATGSDVHISLDHNWTRRHESPELSLPGKNLLEEVARISRKNGDFPWHVAYHPYPENLFEPRFWLDKTAPLSIDAPRITFKNLEVLTEFLKTKEMTYQGKPRRVILSEQGFHRSDETVQAAAYAYAWQRVQRNPGIDAFILHRHVDHSLEGGLLLGLWTRKSDGGYADPDRKTKMWDVMKAAGTPKEEDAMRFALDVVGLRTWKSAGPAKVDKAQGTPKL